MPLLGFGVYQNYDAKTSVLEAFRAGYRCVLDILYFKYKCFDGPNSHVDSAQVYRNEAQVAEAVRESGLDRGEVFISACRVSRV